MIRADLFPRANDPSWRQGWQAVDLADRRPVAIRDMPESGFIFEYFQVDVLLEIEGVDFSLARIGIPAIDFVLALEKAVRELREFGRGDADMSLRPDTVIRLRSQGGLAEVSASYTADTALVEICELQQVAWRLLRKAVTLIVEAHPEAAGNDYLNSLGRLAGPPEQDE